MSEIYLCVTYANDLLIYREAKAAISNLYIPVILPIGLSKRGARRRRSAWCSASLCLFFRRTFSFLHYSKSEVKGNGGRGSLRNNRASRDRASRGKILTIDGTIFCYTMWDRLQWRRNVAEFKVWVPIVSWNIM